MKLSRESRDFLWLLGNSSGRVPIGENFDAAWECMIDRLCDNQFRGGTSRFAAVDGPEAL